MREKLLAQEAKQHDPKVWSECMPLSRAERSIAVCPQGPAKHSKCTLTIVFQVQSQKKRHQQQELIAELRKRQAKDHRPVYEGKDGTIEDIITGGPDCTSRRSRRGPRTTVVIHCSAPLKCTLCYVVHTPSHLESST